MMNEVGCIAWGRMSKGKAKILHSTSAVKACCWHSPWCTWLSEEEFMFKCQIRNTQFMKTPNIIISFVKGVAMVADSNSTEWWSETKNQKVSKFEPYSDSMLLKLAENA